MSLGEELEQAAKRFSERAQAVAEHKSCRFGNVVNTTGCCGPTYRCEKLNKLVTGKFCLQCVEWLAPIKHSAVICARDAGEEVWQTVGSMARSVYDHAVEMEIIVLDDGSKDGCCDFADVLAKRGASGVVLARNNEPVGIDSARNIGLEQATGEVVSWHDAHMSYPKGVMQTLTAEAMMQDAIICPSSTGFENPCNFRGFGCDLTFTPGQLPAVKWVIEQKEPRERRPAPLGGCYVMSRKVAERIKAATGVLWEGTYGHYGYSEEALAMKAFLLDIPVIVLRDAVVAHNYTPLHPIPGDSHGGNVENCFLALLSILGPDVFRKYVSMNFTSLGLPVLDLLTREAKKRWEQAQSAWVKQPEQIFKELVRWV